MTRRDLIRAGQGRDPGSVEFDALTLAVLIVGGIVLLALIFLTA